MGPTIVRGEFDDDSREGLVAVVTGGNSGFGREIVLALAERGDQAFAAFRGTRGGFDSIAADLERRSHEATAPVASVRLDVTDEASVKSGVQEVLDKAGRIDVLVNGAGYGLLGPMECTSVDQARQLFEANILGAMRMTQAVVPTMREQGSGIVLNVGSDVGVRANFYQSAYAASKFAVHGMTQAMRWELQMFGIRVAMIDPGWYSTEFGESVVTTFDSGPLSHLYEAQIKAWNDGVEAVEGPNDDPTEVADVVLRVIDAPEPPFLNTAGWNPTRMAGVSPDEIDEYERRLFDYYELAAFRGTWARGESDA